jgi:hypothetical protein
MSQNNHQQATDLFIESVHRSYPFLRNTAAKHHCEKELDRIQEQLLTFLHNQR